MTFPFKSLNESFVGNGTDHAIPDLSLWMLPMGLDLAYGLILQKLVGQAASGEAERLLTAAERNALEGGQLEHPLSAQQNYPSQSLDDRIRLFQAIYPTFNHRLQSRLVGLTSLQAITMLWQVWMPLAQTIAATRQRWQRPVIQGILGGQGTGKTTLAAILTLILEHLGYPTASLSLDDLYKTYAERRQLQQQDPRLIWRGPPGTHDIDLGLFVLRQLRQSQPHTMIALPRFDKSAHAGAGDRTTPGLVQGIEILLFEGWFVGLRPLEPQAFVQPPHPIVTATDRDFARDMNGRLQEYLPLWDLLDGLIVLKPAVYQWSQQWRKQAEQAMKATGKPGMSDRDLDRFVEYFWKALHPELFLPPLIQQPDRVDWVIELDANHLPQQIYRGGSIQPTIAEY